MQEQRKKNNKKRRKKIKKRKKNQRKKNKNNKSKSCGIRNSNSNCPIQMHITIVSTLIRNKEGSEVNTKSSIDFNFIGSYYKLYFFNELVCFSYYDFCLSVFLKRLVCSILLYFISYADYDSYLLLVVIVMVGVRVYACMRVFICTRRIVNKLPIFK